MQWQIVILSVPPLCNMHKPVYNGNVVSEKSGIPPLSLLEYF